MSLARVRAWERFVGVEDVRRSLGRLMEEIATGGTVVALTKRGTALAVLISPEEHVQLQMAATDPNDIVGEQHLPPAGLVAQARALRQARGHRDSRHDREHQASLTRDPH